MRFKKGQGSGFIVLTILIIIILLIIYIAGAPAIKDVVSSFVATSNYPLLNLIVQLYLPFGVFIIFFMLYIMIRRS